MIDKNMIWNGFNANEFSQIDRFSLSQIDKRSERYSVSPGIVIETYDYFHEWDEFEKKRYQFIAISYGRVTEDLSVGDFIIKQTVFSDKESFCLVSKPNTNVIRELYDHLISHCNHEEFLAFWRSVVDAMEVKLESEFERVESLKDVVENLKTNPNFKVEYTDGYKERFIDVDDLTYFGAGFTGNYHNEEQTRFLFTGSGKTKSAVIEFNVESEEPRIIVHALDLDDLKDTEVEAMYGCWESEKDFAFFASRNALSGIHDYLIFMMGKDYDWVAGEEMKKCEFPGIGKFIQNFYEG